VAEITLYRNPKFISGSFFKAISKTVPKFVF
jgi:hypothetical protein